MKYLGFLRQNKGETQQDWEARKNKKILELRTWFGKQLTWQDKNSQFLECHFFLT